MYTLFSVISEELGKGFVYFFLVYINTFVVFNKKNILLATVLPCTRATIGWGEVSQYLVYITFKEAGNY